MPTIFAAQVRTSSSHSFKLLLLRAEERERDEEKHPSPESWNPVSGLSSRSKSKVLGLTQFIVSLVSQLVFFHVPLSRGKYPNVACFTLLGINDMVVLMGYSVDVTVLPSKV